MEADSDSRRDRLMPRYGLRRALRISALAVASLFACQNSSSLVDRSGDYDGDHRVDRILITQQQPNGEFSIVVQLATGAVFELMTGPKSRLSDLDVEVMSPGIYRSSCLLGAGAGCTELKGILRSRNDSIKLNFEETATVIFYYQDGQFKRFT